jgi:hypothetical protein
MKSTLVVAARALVLHDCAATPDTAAAFLTRS